MQSATVASDRPQVETTCHTVNSASGEKKATGEYSFCPLGWGGWSLPLLPGTEQVSLLVLLFTTAQAALSLPGSQNGIWQAVGPPARLALETCGFLHPCHAWHPKA